MSYADVNGLSLYYEEHGAGEPLVLLHGGFGAGELMRPIIPALAAGRRVIAVDLQGHGHTADIDRPLRPEHMADDIAALIAHLGLERADVMGYSLGGTVALRTAIQHPERVRRLVVVSVAFRRDGSHPEVLEAMDQMGPAAVRADAPVPARSSCTRGRRRGPRTGRRSSPRPPTSSSIDYDWTAEIEAMTTPTLLVFADADSIRPEHIVEFYALLGGGLHDAGWDRSRRPVAQLAILPGTDALRHLDVTGARARRDLVPRRPARSRRMSGACVIARRRPAGRADEPCHAAASSAPGDGRRPVSAAGAGRRRGARRPAPRQHCGPVAPTTSRDDVRSLSARTVCSSIATTAFWSSRSGSRMSSARNCVKMNSHPRPFGTTRENAPISTPGSASASR